MVEKGSVITPPQQPVDKDVYTFDFWEGYTEGMTATENMTFKAVYKKNIKTKTEIYAGGKAFMISPVGIEKGKMIILALYNNGEFVGTKRTVYNGDIIGFATEKEYTNAKVMVWDSLMGGKPEGEAEIIK